MNLEKMIKKVKNHPQAEKMGMILTHCGIVRGTDREGRAVSGLRVTVDHDQLKNVVAQNKQQPGIIEILIDIAENRDLSVGDDVMLLVVAGDIREHVIATLTETLNAVKSTVTAKQQFYV